jgi:hypothetical protein
MAWLTGDERLGDEFLAVAGIGVGLERHLRGAGRVRDVLGDVAGEKVVRRAVVGQGFGIHQRLILHVEDRTAVS